MHPAPHLQDIPPTLEHIPVLPNLILFLPAPVPALLQEVLVVYIPHSDADMGASSGAAFPPLDDAAHALPSFPVLPPVLAPFSPSIQLLHDPAPLLRRALPRQALGILGVFAPEPTDEEVDAVGRGRGQHKAQDAGDERVGIQVDRQARLSSGHFHHGRVHDNVDSHNGRF